jgi:hypothetical protein
MPTGVYHDIDQQAPTSRTRATLLSVALEIPASELTRGGVNRLAAGVTWLPWPDVVANREAILCETIYDKDAGIRTTPAIVTQPGFLMWDRIQCSTAGIELDLLAEMAAKSVDDEGFLSAVLAMELEDAEGSGGIGLVGNITYQPYVASATAVGLDVALANLEAYLASASTTTGASKPGVRGVIHLTPGLLTIAVADGLVEWRDGNYQTPTGHLVIGDAGHTGQDTPYDQSAPGDGEAWIYATGDVFYATSPLHGVTRQDSADSGPVYLAQNKIRPLVERDALVVFDPNILSAALVTVGSSDGGGSSGAAGGATAANQEELLALANPTIVIDQVTADETIAAANFLWGYSLKETSDSAVAVVSIHHGSASSDPVIGFINLAASESIPPTMLSARIPTPNGIHFEVASGAVSGAIYYEA